MAFFLLFAPTQAQASSGTFTKTEFFNECFAGPSVTCSVDTISSTEDNCGCTGSLGSSWTDSSGQKHRQYLYNNSWGTGEVQINYRLKSGGKTWIATSGTWCGSDGCIYIQGI